MSFVVELSASDISVIPPSTGFRRGPIVYPANWIEQATSAERAGAGIYIIVDDPKPNEDFWNVVQTITKEVSVYRRSFTKTPRNLALRKIQMLVKLNRDARDLLENSDYYILRAAETCINTPLSVVAYRASIREVVNSVTSVINAAATISDLETVSAVWPDKPTTVIFANLV